MHLSSLKSIQLWAYQCEWQPSVGYLLVYRHRQLSADCVCVAACLCCCNEIRQMVTVRQLLAVPHAMSWDPALHAEYVTRVAGSWWCCAAGGNKASGGLGQGTGAVKAAGATGAAAKVPSLHPWTENISKACVCAGPHAMSWDPLLHLPCGQSCCELVVSGLV